MTVLPGRWLRLKTEAEACRDCAADQASAYRARRYPPRRRTATSRWVPTGDNRTEAEVLAAARSRQAGEQPVLVCELHKIERIEDGYK